MLKVIGAGLGRTGTHSLKLALEKLGFDKCYHMSELIQHPQDLPFWEKTLSSRQIDWEQVFQGYQSAVDYPAAYFYRELMDYYPDAKVILTLRNAESWYESARSTIYPSTHHPLNRISLSIASHFNENLRNVQRMLAYNNELIWNRQFQGRFENRAFAVNEFNHWNESVKQTVPADRLLVYEAKQGWEPLCQFLDVPVPDEPYPNTNSREEFQGRMMERNPLARLIFR